MKLERKKSLAVGVACMAIYGSELGFKGRTFELRVLNKSVFNFYVRSTHSGVERATIVYRQVKVEPNTLTCTQTTARHQERHVTKMNRLRVTG